MKLQNETDYLYQIESGVLVIIDLNRGISVTNNIKYILLEIKDELGELPDKIIYRDSQGEFDGVEHKNGQFKRFFPVRESDLQNAIEKVGKWKQ